jgi:hypothetical protein
VRHEIIIEAVPWRDGDGYPHADLAVRCTCGAVLEGGDKSRMTLQEVTQAVSGHYLGGVQN